MGIKSGLITLFARRVTKSLRNESHRGIFSQDKTLENLIGRARNTAFGKDHGFDAVKNAVDYRKAVPIRGYEHFRPYIDRIIEGEKDVLWPGLPNFFAKTSGTTSGTKFIPMTRESTPHHVNTARNSVFNYIVETGNNDFLNGKMLYLSGSPELTETNGIKTGRLSGIVNHQVPNYLQGNKMPSYKVNCISEWERKVEAIIHETHKQDVRLIGGIPPWVQMYYEGLLDFTGKSTIKEVFPNLSLFVYGGVNYEPYRATLEELVGGQIDSIETFPASEGFFAFQDLFPHEGLLLNCNAGMYFEFVPLEEIDNDQPSRLSLLEVETGKNYALIVSSNAGLWSYNIGDTVEFVSLDPPRIIVSGRIKHFISAFGEHVIGKEVEQAIITATESLNLQINEFTVAPQVNPDKGLPYHEWFIEFSSVPDDLDKVEAILDESMQDQNIYYKDLIQGAILRRARVTPVKPHTFRHYMDSIGKLGGQNKLPRLSNDRKIADQLIPYRVSI